MLKFRWTVAGGKSFPFSKEAVDEIYKATKGVPRSIVKLANEALIKTAVDRKRKVTKDAVILGASELYVELV